MTTRWHIRLATADDAAAVAAIYRPVVETTAISFEIAAPGDAEMRQRITDTLAAYPWLVCVENEDVVGYAYGSRHRARAAYQWAVETTVYVADRARGRGVGAALYAALLPMLTTQGFGQAYAGIALPNAGSIALHERAGFTRIGVFRHIGYKFGQWHDVEWWQRPLAGAAAAPSPPLSMAAMRQHPEWDVLSVRRGER